MKPLIGFTFIYNALHGAYPILESLASYLPFVDRAVVVDLGSKDGTWELLRRLTRNSRLTLVQRPWDLNKGPSELKTAWTHHVDLCRGGVVLHVEADEVLDSRLGPAIQAAVQAGDEDLTFIRYQVEQNFQRIRWGGTPCHRIWPAGSVTRREHTTLEFERARVLSPEVGTAWDCTNCFRDQYLDRIQQNDELWQQGTRYFLIPEHRAESCWAAKDDLQARLAEPHWLWKWTPHKIPGLVAGLLGCTRYSIREDLVELIAADDCPHMIQRNLPAGLEV